MRHTDPGYTMVSETFSVQNKLEVHAFWNVQLLPWITWAIIGIYMVFYSPLVILNMMALGAFPAMIDIYKECGDRFNAWR